MAQTFKVRAMAISNEARKVIKDGIWPSRPMALHYRDGFERKIEFVERGITAALASFRFENPESEVWDNRRRTNKEGCSDE